MARKTRRELQAAKNAAAVDFEPPWVPNPDEHWDEVTDQVEPDQTSRISDRTRRYTRTGMLIEFAVTYSVLIDGVWQEVLCVDTCQHGTVHRHRDGDHDSESQLIAKITDPDVIQSQHFAALDEAYDRYTKERDRHD